MSNQTNLSDALLHELSQVLIKHGASLFFGDSPAALWMDGYKVGMVRDDDSRCGEWLIVETGEGA